ncbi:uncharacterized protein syt18b isoform X2 [Pelmatolapia mariae]|uniref:uncharacterized protein syt18b isoform X2 n=1 Tax=Pelmatolapia mariae TaxID=158779 RepID=UPI002FE57268
MPYHDEEYPGQPLWQSVLLFCCKGMIEGIMVILFFWLLVQVLFTKQLEVHLQILLLVGLITFCLCLVLGCLLCLWKSKVCRVKDKAPVTSAPAPAEPVSFAQTSPPPSAAATASASKQQFEELDEEVLEYPSTFSSAATSEGEFGSLAFSNQTSCEQKEPPKSYFSLRRLSTPLLSSPLYKPLDQSHSSLPSFPKLGLLAKTRKALQRRCTVTGEHISYNEHTRLTRPSAGSPSTKEKPIPLTPLSYGSSASCQHPISPKPCLHFAMAFSPEQQTLTVTVLSLSGTPHRLEDVSVQGSLPPLCPFPMQAAVQNSSSSEAHSLVLIFKVSSVEELQRCVLKVALNAREPASPRHSSLGELEAECAGRDWTPQTPLHLTKELNRSKWKIKKGYTSNAVLSEARVVGRVFVGAEDADAGRAHWRDMCSRHLEQARCHTIQPETAIE